MLSNFYYTIKHKQKSKDQTFVKCVFPNSKIRHIAKSFSLNPQTFFFQTGMRKSKIAYEKVSKKRLASKYKFNGLFGWRGEQRGRKVERKNNAMFGTLEGEENGGD